MERNQPLLYSLSLLCRSCLVPKVQIAPLNKIAHLQSTFWIEPATTMEKKKLLDTANFIYHMQINNIADQT